MDPLSILASSITIAGTASIALKAIHQAYIAKPELLALLNEITDVTAILREVERSMLLEQETNSPIPVPDNDSLFAIISETKTKLEQLAENASRWTTKPTASGSTDGLHLRWLRIALKIKNFRNDFRSLRSKLKIILPALTVQGSSRIELDLRQIMLFARETAANQSTLHGEFKSELEEHRSYLENLSQQLTTRHVLSPLETTVNVVGNIQNITTTADAEESLANDEEVIRAFHHNGSVLFESSQMTAISAVGIRTAQFPRSACQPWCSCECHTEHRLRSPQFLDQVIGSLFVGYSGLPGLTRKCNQYSCHLRSQPMTYITYFFPQWFLARTISFVLSSTPLAGPVVSLKVSRTVPGDSAIFTYAKTGDVTKIKSLFEGGLASPHDVHFESGITALHLAISHRQFSVCRFLLQANADPFMEDRTSWTAADNAWTKILSKSLDPESETSLRTMFSATECLERRDFTVLHKIVLGFLSLDLEMELSASTAEIDRPDSNARTPISIAAERGDSRSVRTLLRYGADPNIGSSCQASPLHFAASATDPDCIPLLLQHNAHIESVTNWDQTALHYVAAYTKDARHAELLLGGGANPNAIDLDGIDPLGWAAITGNTPVAEVLLNYGATISSRSKSGDSALAQSIRGHHHETLALLISHGAHAELNLLPGNQTLWDTVVTVADAGSMQLLQGASLTDGPHIYLDATHLRELFGERTDLSHELVSAFQALAERYFGGHTAQEVEENMVDVWEDAVETL